MTYKTIEYAAASGVATITLNRPERLNSITALMHGELQMALDEVDQDGSIRCVRVTGAGRGFCAGQDLHEHEAGAEPRDLGASLDSLYNPLIRRLKSLELPVVAAVNGVAAGAGASLALACDFVLAAASASFVQSFCRIGLIPDAGGTWALPRLVGHARALGLALLGDSLSAQDAAAWGLIWKCVPDEQLQEESDALCRHLAQQPTRALALIKRALHASLANDLDTQLDLERDLQRLAGHTADFAEGVAAFREKRKPSFRGR